MLCVIYRSPKRDQTYLYVEKRRFLSCAGRADESFGVPQFAMMLSLDERKKLASADIEKVKQALKDEGYYLQFPPPVENLLNQHLAGDKA